ncbi:MAG: YciI family protein [Pseudobdellovibrionaceae bacterium]|nr:YciI family protein [Pseudobdellovibrionaceae bacterium]
MKYMLLIYSREDAWTETEMAACMAESRQLCHDLAAKGQYLAASPLHSVTTATSVQLRQGKRLITDGPFAETNEQLGGYYIVDVPDLDAAIEIASRIPGSKRGTVEIRPVFQLDGMP